MLLSFIVIVFMDVAFLILNITLEFVQESHLFVLMGVSIWLNNRAILFIMPMKTYQMVNENYDYIWYPSFSGP